MDMPVLNSLNRYHFIRLFEIISLIRFYSISAFFSLRYLDASYKRSLFEKRRYVRKNLNESNLTSSASLPTTSLPYCVTLDFFVAYERKMLDPYK